MHGHDDPISHPMKRSLFPALATFLPASSDVATVPSDSTSLRLVEEAVGFSRLPQLSLLTKLWCFGINADRLRIIAQCVKLKHLFVENLRVADLSPIERLQSLVCLSLEVAPKVASLDQLAELGWLEGLRVEHFKSVTSLEPLKRLSNLQGLAVAGSIWTRLTVDSLSPLSARKS